MSPHNNFHHITSLNGWARAIAEWRKDKGFMTPKSATEPSDHNELSGMTKADAMLCQLGATILPLFAQAAEAVRHLNVENYRQAMSELVAEAALLARDVPTAKIVAGNTYGVTNSLASCAKLVLVASELGEAVEAIRCADRENYEEELADAIIRILDLCGTQKININSRVHKKMLINAKRPVRHGKATSL